MKYMLDKSKRRGYNLHAQEELELDEESKQQQASDEALAALRKALADEPESLTTGQKLVRDMLQGNPCDQDNVQHFIEGRIISSMGGAEPQR